MMAWDPHTVVIVPGLRGHVEDHWQTWLARQLPHVRVLPFGHDKRDLASRVADLQEVVEASATPVTIVAHSAGVLTTIHWARQHGEGVRAALLATPPTLHRPLPAAYPTLAELETSGWLPVPRERLPFPSIVAASTDDDLGDYGLLASLAASWGSDLIDIGPVGHLNPASGYGEWAGARCLLDLLEAKVDGTLNKAPEALLPVRG